MTQTVRPNSIRVIDIERSVAAVLQGGAQVHRVTVDVAEGKIVIDTAPDPKGPKSFDSLSFRR